MKNCLISSFPFVVGISVYQSFESASVAITGIVPMPNPKDQCLGGHAVICIGYDDSKQSIMDYEKLMGYKLGNKRLLLFTLCLFNKS